MQLAQCPRCQQYGWLDDVAGFKVLADAETVGTPEKMRDALIAGKSVYEIKGTPGNLKLLLISARHLGGKLKSGAKMVADHGCGAPPRDAVPVGMAPQGPQRAPVMPGRPADGFHPRSAPESGSQGRTAPRPSAFPTAKVTFSDTYRNHAPDASRPPSRPTRCGVCNRIITGDEKGISGVEYDGRWIFAYHEAC